MTLAIHSINKPNLYPVKVQERKSAYSKDTNNPYINFSGLNVSPLVTEKIIPVGKNLLIKLGNGSVKFFKCKGYIIGPLAIVLGLGLNYFGWENNHTVQEALKFVNSHTPPESFCGLGNVLHSLSVPKSLAKASYMYGSTDIAVSAALQALYNKKVKIAVKNFFSKCKSK